MRERCASQADSSGLSSGLERSPEKPQDERYSKEEITNEEQNTVDTHSQK
jgi:hypothetical protein